MNFAQWAQMGGYAEYVWAAVGLTLVVMFGHLWWANRRLKDTLAAARALAELPASHARPARVRITETTSEGEL